MEVCGLGALNTHIISSETLPPQNDHITILATPQKMSWLHHCREIEQFIGISKYQSSTYKRPACTGTLLQQWIASQTRWE